MMRIVKWSLLAAVALIIFGFFNYTLPRHEVVRIVGVNTQRMDLGPVNSWFYGAPDAGSAANSTNSRDIKFIQTILPNGRPLVFRNEDTGWGWPPYFKFDSFDLQTEASNLTSTEAAPKWVMITRYGWRNQILSTFPNAVRLRAVSGPDATVIPWANIIILTLIAVLLLLLRRTWRRFRARRIDPMVEEMGETWDDVDARTDAMRDRVKGWAGRLFGRRRR